MHTLKLVHDRFKPKAADGQLEDFLSDLRSAMQFNPELGAHASKAQQDLTPVVVLDLFKRISDEDCELLWMDSAQGRPEKLLLQAMLVPPVPIRPSVAMDTGAGSNEDDLTVKMQEIVGVNNALKVALDRGATVKMLMEDWYFLQVQVAQYLNGEMPGLAKPIGEKQPIRGLCQRLKVRRGPVRACAGVASASAAPSLPPVAPLPPPRPCDPQGKSGRFRGNLSGKRVDFSGRTVISPDPNLRIDQVGVPQRVAMTMTFPERVSRYNIDFLRRLVENGPNKHPGANYVRTAENIAKSLHYGDRTETAANLAIGDVVERHMIDGDVVLFNRQPSLHKLSIMSHRVKVWRERVTEGCVTCVLPRFSRRRSVASLRTAPHTHTYLPACLSGGAGASGWGVGLRCWSGHAVAHVSIQRVRLRPVQRGLRRG